MLLKSTSLHASPQALASIGAGVDGGAAADGAGVSAGGAAGAGVGLSDGGAAAAIAAPVVGFTRGNGPTTEARRTAGLGRGNAFDESEADVGADVGGTAATVGAFG